MIKPLGIDAYKQVQLVGKQELMEPSRLNGSKNQSMGQHQRPPGLSTRSGKENKFVPQSQHKGILIDKFDEKTLKKLRLMPCETCENRRYQDRSNDPGVSFKSPTHIRPELSGPMVASHEMEHVVREQANAESEGREVISQSVRLHGAICPECGISYIASGVTETITAPKRPGQSDQFKGNLVDMKL